MKTSFEIKQTFPVEPSEIYSAWLNSKKHSKMTGGAAECNSKSGGSFSAWDGYIWGTNVRLEPDKEIVQKWRTSEFKDSDPDSDLIIKLRKVTGGCELILIHKNIPAGQPDYKKGWVEHYFNPMHDFFG